MKKTISVWTLIIAYSKLVIKQQIQIKKLQFIHIVNGYGSKTAKMIKRQC